jgi:hypothetical protein
MRSTRCLRAMISVLHSGDRHAHHPQDAVALVATLVCCDPFQDFYNLTWNARLSHSSFYVGLRCSGLRLG